MEEKEVLKFDHLPSPQHFTSQIESRNIPAVFKGCIKDWKALSKWDPSNGGLDYLQEQVGDSVVEAMLSRSAPVFYGDLRSHEMVPIPFSTFITSCKRLGNSHISHSISGAELGQDLIATAGDEVCLDPPNQIYLAQVPILNLEGKGMSQLKILREDIQMPSILETKGLASINLWMNNAKSRSSTHYDPHHNLLCIVAGCKQVVLWPPSASPMLYPMPIHGEASNHSSVDLEKPDFSIHSRAESSMEYSQKVILHAGDALFIPEGWFHQVDSDNLTIGVNYWWQSNVMSSMPEHMDAYFLRILLRRLVNRKMDQLLHGTSVGSENSRKLIFHDNHDGQTDHYEREFCNKNGLEDSKGIGQKNRKVLHQLEPNALQALHQLVCLVNDGINVVRQTQPEQTSSADSSLVDINGKPMKAAIEHLFCVKDDPVADILWFLEPLELQNVLLAMVHQFPRTLEALILHMLSPVGAEVLARKFDQMDGMFIKEDRDQFYQEFYGVFDDHYAAMDAILSRKESFALQAFRNVLDEYLGVNFDGSKLLT